MWRLHVRMWRLHVGGSPWEIKKHEVVFGDTRERRDNRSDVHSEADRLLKKDIGA
jgi:hypothetical protein